MRNYRAVVFDLDGVLIDSSAGIRKSLDVALLSFGFTKVVDNELRELIGPPLAIGVRSFLQSRGLPTNLTLPVVEEFRRSYREVSVQSTTLMSGVEPMLRALSACHLVLGIATSKPSATTAPIVAALGIADLFSSIASPCEGSDETKTTTLGRALSELGCAGSHAAMVGDRSHDVVAALHHGCEPVGAMWGYGTAYELRSAGATVLFGHPDAFVAWLLSSPTLASAD